MKTLKEQIVVMQYFANGGEIEFNNGIDWQSILDPQWNWVDYDYRIKTPKKTITIEKWLTYNKLYDTYTSLETSKIDVMVDSRIDKVTLLDSYEVELCN